MPELPRWPVVPIEPEENREIVPDALSLAITPTEAHFVRCHFRQPAPPSEITIGGAVAEPASISLDALRALDQRTLPVTLECAGTNRAAMAPLPPGEPWRRGAVSTAVWTGVPLAALLERAGIRDDVVEILVRGADRGTPEHAPSEIAYERALPVGQDALVALEMNGAPIPVERGGPIRLIVPGWYGMASVKWVAAVEALTRPFDGWFQTRDYIYDDGPVTTTRVDSRIVEPREESLHLLGAIRAWGWAWSGAAPIASLEISLDAGPWRRAALEKTQSAAAWVSWETTLEVTHPGHHSLRARARDRDGNVQPDAPIWNRLGYGNNAVEIIRFAVQRRP
jgi:DMSO/TMAO reductase YedYZ molybdopterin-dependent catalytic subunit